ncbi:MAG TPA: nucleoside triphosphate pyrophosphohydrolase [Flavitalea sp.]|nr:nucleoside triphosphate pyrophosphohydrolase [Flavitalea sp.]
MQQTSEAKAFMRLKEIVDELREKCPWDRKQTIDSLRSNTIEELYELADAITDHDWKGIREELGDLLLHILFYARIGTEQKQLTLEEVINGISEKLISRHPHIYGDIQAADEETVKMNWEKLKLKEGKTSVLSGVPKSLPAVVKATRLQEKSRQVGFEWETAGQVWDKVEEEIHELKEAAALNDKDKIEDEFGDVLFSLINYARFLQIDAENSLERTNKKFISRFTRMEQQALKQGRALGDMTLQEMDAIWDAIKKQNTGT